MLDLTAYWQKAANVRRLRERALRRPERKGTGSALGDSEVHSESARVKMRRGRVWVTFKENRHMGLCSRCGGCLPNCRVHRWCAECLRDYKQQRFGASDLYVMQNSRIPGELKIGRSQDVEARRHSLQRSQNFRMLVLAVFPQAGHMERSVHEMLAYCRVPEEVAAGREWFCCSPQTAFSAIGQALAA